MVKGSKLIKEFKTNQDGAVIVIIAAFMTVLIGLAALVLDLGLAFNKKAELQKDLDSIALAAVSELPATTESEWGKAVAVAAKYAELNGLASVNTEKIENSEKTKVIGIKVSSNVDVPYSFASIFGPDKGNVALSSTAEIRSVDGGVKGLLPFVIDEESMKRIKSGSVNLITIKTDADLDMDDPEAEFGNGWFGPVDIDRNGSSSASEYTAKIAAGSTVPLDIGDTLNLVGGNKVGPTADGFNIRFVDHFACTYNSVTQTASCGCNCPRICTVPIVKVHMTEDNKRVDYLEVISYASIFVELDSSYYKNGEIKLTGNEGDIKVTFIKETLVPDASTGDIPEDRNFGFYSPRLVD